MAEELIMIDDDEPVVIEDGKDNDKIAVVLSNDCSMHAHTLFIPKREALGIASNILIQLELGG
jgi:hypothetical protein